MTTETQTQTWQQQQDDPNVWLLLGRLQANQEIMLQRMDRMEARMDRLETRMDRLLYAMIAMALANAGAMAAGFWAITAALSG